jgi:hypothetical protein
LKSVSGNGIYKKTYKKPILSGYKFCSLFQGKYSISKYSVNRDLLRLGVAIRALPQKWFAEYYLDHLLSE